ncbi:hypothetical protein CDAR_393381 [Caerostris darwini]|uniref:Uncharacterized protein n=1 Tax=Caerostris darwini TaxID=1538125 RepID=A0AAV4QEG1_9ARAC|nr:hypothetical protein CDAR_393381 [Caerostris darwini]
MEFSEYLTCNIRNCNPKFSELERQIFGIISTQSKHVNDRPRLGQRATVAKIAPGSISPAGFTHRLLTFTFPLQSQNLFSSSRNLVSVPSKKDTSWAISDDVPTRLQWPYEGQSWSGHSVGVVATAPRPSLTMYKGKRPRRFGLSIFLR